MTLQLRPTAPIAPDALLPGDPGRALALAQNLLERPRMANHHRGLWGYSGRTLAGRELTIQATGIGGPSAAVVLGDLARHGVRRAIRVGTCAGLDQRTAPGSLLIAEAALAAEGSSRALGAEGRVGPNPELHSLLADATRGSAQPATVASVDVRNPGLGALGGRAGHEALAVEMGTATLFALGARRGIAVASALVVAECAGGGRLDDEELEQESLRLGAFAARALGG